MSISKLRDDVADAIAYWRERYGYKARRDLGALAEFRRIDIRDDGDGPHVDVARAFTTGRTPYAPEGFAGLRRKVADLLDAADGDAPFTMATEERRTQNDFDERLAAVAAVLGSVRENRAAKGGLGHCLGEDDIYREARFKRLTRMTTAPELLREGRRIVHLVEVVPVADFARAFLFWDHIEAKRLTKDYYDAIDRKITADA
jgi:hypothetical protein